MIYTSLIFRPIAQRPPCFLRLLEEPLQIPSTPSWVRLLQKEIPSKVAGFPSPQAILYSLRWRRQYKLLPKRGSRVQNTQMWYTTVQSQTQNVEPHSKRQYCGNPREASQCSRSAEYIRFRTDQNKKKKRYYFRVTTTFINDDGSINVLTLIGIELSHNLAKWCWKTYISDGEGQPPTGIIRPIHHVHNRRTCLFSWCSCINDGGDIRVVAPRHVYGSNWMNDDDGIVTNACDTLYELTSAPPEFKIVPVCHVTSHDVIKRELAAHAATSQ